MAGVLGNFMRHSRNRSDMQRRREILKADREARSKGLPLDAAQKAQLSAGTQGKGKSPSRQPPLKDPLQHAPNRVLIKGKQGKKGHKQQFDLLVTIDLVEYGLTDDLVADFKEAFMLFDKDEDGLISQEELGVVMRSLGQRPSDHELRKLVSEVNKTCEGYVEFNEFLQLMSKKLKMIGNEAELKEAFKVFDKKNAGYLSTNELRHVMTSMGERMSEEEVDDMLKEASPNGDGRVNYEQFVNIIARKH